jgi:hypothetical protein
LPNKKYTVSAYLSDEAGHGGNPDGGLKAVMNYRDTVNLPAINEKTAQKLGADVSPDVVNKIIDTWMNTAFGYACRGYDVKTKWFKVNANVVGKFDGPKDTFADDRHKAALEIALGDETKDLWKDIGVEIVKRGAEIKSVIDEKTGKTNKALSPGGTLRIRGNNIKIEGTAPSVGVNFVNPSAGVHIQVGPSVLIGNADNEVAVKIPEKLPDGPCRLDIKTQFAGPGEPLLAEPLTIYFTEALNAAK